MRRGAEAERDAGELRILDDGPDNAPDNAAETVGQESDAWSVYRCETVSKNWTAAGHLTAEFGYLGTGGYVFARSVGGGLWSPATGDQPYGVELTP